VNPVEALIYVLREYLKVHGKHIESMCRVLGQECIRIEVGKVLYRYHSEVTGYSRFEDIISEILSSEELQRKLMEYGVRVEVDEESGTKYLVVDISSLRKLMT